jgi:surfeit locus 1 family protein
VSPARSINGFIILYVLGLSLLFGLSIWQYQRGVEKQRVAAKRLESSPEVLSAVPDNLNDFIYRNGNLSGRWLGERSFLMENRIYQGRVGYEVLTPFRLAADEKILLVNRGWVPSPEAADRKTGAGITTINGVLYFPEKGVALGDAILPEAMNSNAWPKKALYIDLPVFSRALNTDIENTVFVLDENNPAAYKRIWKAAVMPAAKHFGYAVQWLGLALTLLIYGVIWIRRRQ